MNARIGDERRYISKWSDVEIVVKVTDIYIKDGDVYVVYYDSYNDEQVTLTQDEWCRYLIYIEEQQDEVAN